MHTFKKLIILLNLLNVSSFTINPLKYNKEPLKKQLVKRSYSEAIDLTYKGSVMAVSFVRGFISFWDHKGESMKNKFVSKIYRGCCLVQLSVSGIALNFPEIVVITFIITEIIKYLCTLNINKKK